MGKLAILGALVTGVLFAFAVVFFKTGSLQADPLTHWFNELSYYVKNGFVVIVTAAVFLIRPSRRLVLGALLGSMAMHLGFTLVWYPETSYLVRSGWVIVLSFAAVAVPTMMRQGWRIPAPVRRRATSCGGVGDRAQLRRGGRADDDGQGWRIPLRDLVAAPDRGVARFGAGLLASLVLAHVLFH